MHDELLDKALKLKGYGSDKSLTCKDKGLLEKEKKVDKNLTVKPKVITCLNEYIDFIGSLDFSYKNPVFYRGQGNANFPINPNSLRNVNAGEKFPDFAGLKFPLSGKKIY